MSNYELTYVLRPLEEANLTATSERISTIVQNAGGEIVARNDWGRRRLAYPIRKVNDGYYTTLYIKLPGASVRGVERSLQLIDDVQRYLVVRVEEFKLPSAAPAETPAPPAGEAAPTPATAPVAEASASRATEAGTAAASTAGAPVGTTAGDAVPASDTAPVTAEGS